ncbi:MAG: hypothetical protein RLY70_2895 [Planctomycetota bacterium]
MSLWPKWRQVNHLRPFDGDEKVSGLFSGELSSDRIPRSEGQNVQTKRVEFIMP